MPVSTDLKYFLSCLSAAEHVPRPEGEEWKATIERLSNPGRIADIDEETFFYFLEVLPPKYQSGHFFAFAEGAEELRLFWQADGQYFCRQLTWVETGQFCQLAGISLPS